MDDQRFGAAMRAARVRRGWRQADLASRAGISRGSISRIERGHLDKLTFETVRRVASALQIRLEVLPRSSGADFDRIVNARHAKLTEAVVRWLASVSGWVVRPEVSFSVYGERGVVDLVAWHGASQSLLLIELKTEIVDVGELLGTFDRKLRLSGAIAASLGHKPAVVASAVVVAESRTNHRRVRDHQATLRSALPADGRTLAAWLRHPSGSVRALTFLSNERGESVRTGLATVRRVRVAARPRPERAAA